MGKNSTKKSFLDWLYYNVGRQSQDFELCYIWKDNGDTKSTKWKKFSESIFFVDFDGYCEYNKIKWFFEKCNQRQILANEIVLDLENKENYKIILNKLIEEKLFFRAYSTGSKGFHFHLFFDRVLNSWEKETIIRYFNCDIQKSSNKTMIALEFEPHWKSGKPKSITYDNLYLNGEIGYNSLNVKNIGSNLVPHIVIEITPSYRSFLG